MKTMVKPKQMAKVIGMNRKNCILIVDDSATSRSFLNAILGKEGYQIEFASCGREALEKSLTVKPDLLLLDVILPDMNGFEVCQEIRNNPYTSLMPVMMVTSLDDRSSRLQGLHSGADEFLSKPLDALEVRARVKTVLKLDRFRRLLYDQITGLPNEMLFIDYIDNVMLGGDDDSGGHDQFAVLVVKLSNAMFFNNYLSKIKNQEAINRLVEILQGENQDVKIISYNKEGHFAILLDGAGRNEAAGFAENIIRIFKSPIQYMDGEMLLTCKIGIALFPDNGTTGGELVNNARLAFGEKHIENFYMQFYDETIKETYRNNIEIATNLYNAVEKKEFVLHFQPQIKTVSREIIGIEALIRWNSKKYGFAFPDFFICRAEENGAIINMGNWVIKDSLRYLAQLMQMKFTLPEIAINVSALQFSDPSLESKIVHFTKMYELNPEKIKIEITESSIIGDPEDSQQKMRALKEKGYKISIDDFGTGYSSLVYLKNYPVDEIKIDKVFIQNLNTQKINYEIVKYIIELAHTLKMQVVAEGVEKEEQLELLKKLGCDVIQGYYFSKPVSEKEMTALLWQQPFLKI